MKATARKPDPKAAAHNAAIDAVAEWLRAHARRLLGAPVIGGVLCDQLADQVVRLKRTEP